MDENGEVLGARLGERLKRLGLRPEIYGVRKISEFVTLYPEVLQPLTKKAGADLIYSVKLPKTQCHNCNALIIKGITECHNCGTKINTSSASIEQPNQGASMKTVPLHSSTSEAVAQPINPTQPIYEESLEYDVGRMKLELANPTPLFIF
jgi:hypothetical protein